MKATGGAGPKSQKLWLKLALFAILSVAGLFLYAFFGGVWAGMPPDEDSHGAIHDAFKAQLLEQFVFLLVMMWVGLWSVPNKLSKRPVL